MNIAVIRMIEEMNQGRPRQIPTILNGLDEESDADLSHLISMHDADCDGWEQKTKKR
jgi:hypothetical protein